MEIFKWLDDSSFVDSYHVNEFRKSDSAFYLNLKVLFTDRSMLQVREFVSSDHRKYSFHWQKESGELIPRWDNAPHFPTIVTFPHHRHLSDGSVTESYDISIESIFKSIYDYFKNQ